MYVDSALKNLKQRKNDGNTNQIRRLMEMTLIKRRQWIESEANKTISDIVNEYPQLKNSDLMIFKIFNMKKISEETGVDNIKKMFEQLRKFFNVAEDHDKSKASIRTRFCNKLTKRNKSIRPLFIIQEKRSSTTILNTEESESPRCVLCTSI